MSSPLLVTKAEVEDINRALIDLAGQRSVSVSGAPGGETIKLLPMATEVAYTIQANEKASTFLITTGSASDFTINLNDMTGFSGRVFDFFKIDSGAGSLLIVPQASPQQYINSTNTTVTLTAQNYHIRIVGTVKGWYVVSIASTGMVAAPLPQTAAGVGQAIGLRGASGGAYVAPAGGTWQVNYFRITVAGVLTAVGSYPETWIGAGGTTIQAAAGTDYWLGWAWRIA